MTCESSRRPLKSLPNYECLLLPLSLLPLARHHGMIILLGGLPEGLLKKMRAFVRPAIHQHDLRRKLLEVYRHRG